MGDQGLIVVGVDGSESARKALEFALEEAARRPARVRAVAAFQFPRYWPVAIGMASGMVLPPSSRELAEAAEQAARQTITDATGRVGGGAGAVPVEVRVVEGSPAKVLLEQAAGADLLVVGHRGLGGIASACLGSVGLQCVLHATCPVVVVRSAAAAQAGEERVAVAVGGATA